MMLIKFYCNTKDKATVLCNSFLFYDCCPSCGASYIGKTETLYERTVEHAWTDKNSAI